MTFLELSKRFPTEKSIVEHYISIRYGGHAICNHCGSIKVYQRNTNIKIFDCNNCGNTFSPFKDTIFEKSSTDLRKWFFAIHLFLNGKKGISGCQLQREIGVTYKTAWRMLQQIRKSMGNAEQEEFFDTIVEIDETYVGGKPRKTNKHDKDDDSNGNGNNSTSSTASQQSIVIDGITYDAQVVRETANKLKVIVEDGNTKTIVVYNKKTGIMDVDTYDRKKNNHKTEIIDVEKEIKKHKSEISTIKTSIKSPYMFSKPSSMFTSYGQVIRSNSDIWWNYAYTVYDYTSYYSWYCRAGSYSNIKNVKESSSNSSDLFSYKSSVDSIKNYQVAFIAAMGTTAAGTAVAVLSAPSGIGAVVGVIMALGGGIGAAYSYWQAYCAKSDANFYYARVR